MTYRPLAPGFIPVVGPHVVRPLGGSTVVPDSPPDYPEVPPPALSEESLLEASIFAAVDPSPILRQRQVKVSQVMGSPVNVVLDFEFSQDRKLSSGSYESFAVVLEKRSRHFGYLYQVASSLQILHRLDSDALDPLVRPFVGLVDLSTLPATEFSTPVAIELVQYLAQGAFRSTVAQESDSRAWCFGLELQGRRHSLDGQVTNPNFQAARTNCSKLALLAKINADRVFIRNVRASITQSTRGVSTAYARYNRGQVALGPFPTASDTVEDLTTYQQAHEALSEAYWNAINGNPRIDSQERQAATAFVGVWSDAYDTADASVVPCQAAVPMFINKVADANVGSRYSISLRMERLEHGESSLWTAFE